MSWGVMGGPGGELPPNYLITGMVTSSDLVRYRPLDYSHTPPAPPPTRVWRNSDDTVWVLTTEYRKPSLGDAGVIGTYRTHERAKEALAEEVGRELTAAELADGAVYTEDQSLEIVEQALD